MHNKKINENEKRRRIDAPVLRGHREKHAEMRRECFRLPTHGADAGRHARGEKVMLAQAHDGKNAVLVALGCWSIRHRC